MTHRIATLAEWREHEARMLADRASWFESYPLRGMRETYTGRYQFGYEIAGYGTVVGHCCWHSHRTREAAEDCGRRFLAGKARRRWRRLREWLFV